MKHFVFACVIAMTVGLCGAKAQTAGRIETYKIPSVTLTTDQILGNRLKGKPVTLTGELRFPDAATDGLPAVILVHGSGGIRDNIDFWSKEINALGAAGPTTFGSIG